MASNTKVRVTRSREVTMTEFVDVEIKSDASEYEAKALAKNLVEAQVEAGHEPNWIPAIQNYMVEKSYTVKFTTDLVDDLEVGVQPPAPAPEPIPAVPSEDEIFF